jgi:crotonobetaine/carnitine-CoA ligase
LLNRLRELSANPPDRDFLVHEGESIDFAAFGERTNRLANALIEMGVRKGDRVTVGMGNSVDFVVTGFAVQMAGAIFNPVNPELGRSALTYIIEHAEPNIVITEAGHEEALRPIAAGLPRPARLAGFGDLTEGIDLGALLASASPVDPMIPIERSDPATLLYTSGTTGDPKGVLQPHAMREWSIPPFIDRLGIREDDVILAVTPLFHSNAWAAVSVALQAGATAVFPRRFHASEFWPLAHDTNATVFFTLGTILAMLLTRDPSELERTSALRLIVGIGSAAIRDQIEKRFGVHQIAENYGATDSACVAMTPLNEPLRDGSAGTAVPRVRIEIQDDEGQALQPGEVGEIAVASPEPRMNYVRAPEETAAAFRGDWFLTGDLGRLDEAGWLYFVDRKQDFIRHRSHNVSSQWVEKTLREHPRVVEAAVIGLPHEVVGQEIMAYVVTDGEVSEEELHSFAAERLAKFEVPHYWQFRDELPKTPTNRIQKYKLREEAGALGKQLLG